MDAGSAIVAGLVLGLSSGGHCFWACASVMGPYLVATERPPTGGRWSTLPAAARALLWYNAGRLAAYLGVGLAVTALARGGATLPAGVQGAARLATAGLLAWAVLRPAREQRGCAHDWTERRRSAAALVVGLLQGLSPCPPFLAAIGLCLAASSTLSGVLLFLALFLGTALYTLPLAFLEPLRRRRWLTGAARVVGGAVAVYLVVSAGLLLRG